MAIINDHLRTEDMQITRFFLSMYGCKKKNIPTNIKQEIIKIYILTISIVMISKLL